MLELLGYNLKHGFTLLLVMKMVVVSVLNVQTYVSSTSHKTEHSRFPRKMVVFENRNH